MEITNVYFKQIILFALGVSICPVTCREKKSELIYILLWSYTAYEPWVYRDLEMGREAFTSRNCSFQNCFITANHSYFDSVLEYDVLIFNAVHYAHYPSNFFPLPINRSELQLYVMACVEPAAYNFLYDYLKEVFNLTWTYKLDSDIVHPYIIVKNSFNEIIGPKINMQWMNINDLPPINSSIINQKLKNKRSAAAWVVSDCFAKDRIFFAINLENELWSKYGLQVDIFGKCGDEYSCPRANTERLGELNSCYDKIESEYYFYLAFENSHSVDYVTEKVLHGLNHFTVPVVFGGADYKRFLPNEIYLDGQKLGVERLAKEMYDIINDPPRYYNFFRWHGYYTFHDAGADNYTYTVCELCAFLNNATQQRNKTVRVYNNIGDWWNAGAVDTFPDNNAFRAIPRRDTTTVIAATEANIDSSLQTTSFISSLFGFLFDK